MSDSVSRFPLEWPVGWTRTPAPRRQWGKFKSGGQCITVFVATQRLERQLEMLGAAGPTLSTNVELRLDGRPRSDSKPGDPGVAVYFRFKGRATVFACDRYMDVADNIAAIAAHVEALRRIDRYGVGTIEQALAGYRALPADTAADWRAVFGFSKDSTPTVDQVTAKWKERAKAVHPDKVGGSDEMMTQANRAKDFALAELGA